MAFKEKGEKWDGQPGPPLLHMRGREGDRGSDKRHESVISREENSSVCSRTKMNGKAQTMS